MQLPFTGRAEQLAQIKNLMAAKEGAFFVVTGHAGIGKSTLLRHIAELYPQQGQVFVDVSDIPPLQTAVEFLQHFAKCAKGLKHTEAALAKIKGTYRTPEDLIALYKTSTEEAAKLASEGLNSEVAKSTQDILKLTWNLVWKIFDISYKTKQEQEKIDLSDPELYLLKALQADCKKQPLIFMDTFERLRAAQVVSQQKISSFYSKLHQNLTPVKDDLSFSDWLERLLEFLKAHGAMVVIAGREVSHWRACSQALQRFTDEDIADLVGCSDYADLQALVANEQTQLALVSLLNRLSFGGIPLWLQLALNFVSLELANGRDVITLAAMKNIDELFATPVCEQDLASANIENASCKLALFKRVMQHNLELEDEAWKMALPRRLDKPVLQILFAERAEAIREAFTKSGLLPAERWVEGTHVRLHEEIRDLLLAYARYKGWLESEATKNLRKQLADSFEQRYQLTKDMDLFLEGLYQQFMGDDAEIEKVKAPDLLYAIVRDLWEEKQFVKVSLVFLQLINIKPDYENAWFGLGIALEQQGKLEEVVNTYKKLLEINPNYEWAWCNLGNALEQQGKLEEAVNAYEKLLEINPNHEWAWCSLGDALYDQGKLEEAVNTYKKLIEINPNHEWVWDDLGDVLSDQGKLEEAVNAYKKQIEITPNHEYSWNGLGLALKKQGKLEEAVNAYKRQIEITPNHEHAWCNLGIALSGQGKLEEAVDAYKKQIDINPSDEDAWNGLGVALSDQGKLEEAVTAYKRQIEIMPNHEYAWNNLGIALSDQGKLEEAVNAYKKLIEIIPNHEYAWYNLGNALHKQGKLEEAVNAYKKQIEIMPNHEYAWYNLGNALRQQGKLEEAVNAYKKQIEIMPNHEYAWNNLGNTLRQQGKLEEAVSVYHKQIESNPNHEYAWNNLGNTLRKQGKFEEAVNAYHKQIEINPNDKYAWNGLGLVLRKQGKLEEAVNAYKKQIEINPNHEYAWNNLGNALRQQSKLEEAVNAYHKQIEINPSDKDAWNGLGNALSDQGKLEEAVNAYKKQIDINPNDEDAWNNLGLTFKEQGKLEEAVNAYNKQINIKSNHQYAWNNLGLAYWEQGHLTKAQESFTKALEINPQDIFDLSNDAELALVQNDNARCLQRIASAFALIDNKQQQYIIFPFLAWLAEPENSPVAIYTAISELDNSVKIDWDFSEIEPAILRLNPEQQRLARQFIAYFKGVGELPRV